MCKYQFRDGTYCQESGYLGSEYCILHMNFPQDKDSDEWKTVNELKNGRIKEKINDKEYNFEGVVLGNFEFYDEFKAYVNFQDAVFLWKYMVSSCNILGICNVQWCHILWICRVHWCHILWICKVHWCHILWRCRI